MTLVPTSLAQRLRHQAAGFRRRPLVREGMWVAAGHGVTAIAGLVSIRLFTELAPQSVFGAANLLIGMLTLGMHALLAPITQTQIRYHTAYNDKGEGDAYTWLIARLAAMSAAAIIALVAAVLLLWPEARAGAGVGLIAWLAAWVAVSVWRNVLIGRVHAERHLKRYALWFSTEAVLLMICTAAILSIWPTVEGYVAGQVIGLTMPLVVFGGIQSPTRNMLVLRNNDLSTRVTRQIVDYGLPFSGFMIMGWLANLSERYVLAGQLDTAAAGVYVAAFGIASRPATMVAGLLADVFRARIFSMEGRGGSGVAQRDFRAWLGAQILASASIAVLFFLFGDLIAKVLLAEGFREGAPAIMCWVAGGYGLLAIALALEIRIFSYEQPRKLLGAKATAAAGNILFAMMLIPIWAINGAAMANAASQLVYLLACTWIVGRYTQRTLSQV